jgi:Membrane protein implicated in regulation of membrane protease activity
MITSLITELGPWTWWIFGLILLGLEVLVPGVFLLWIGLAAIVVGAVSFALWGSPAWAWQIQLLVFAALSVVAVLIGRRVLRSSEGTGTDQPLLNRRIDSLIGRTATLEEPIRNGRGRIRLDDTIWVVRGPDLPAGTDVRVTATLDGDLTVAPA